MSPQTGSFIGLTFTAISRAQQFEILLDALWNVQKIFESNFSIIVLTHFCSLTGMMFVDVSNLGAWDLCKRFIIGARMSAIFMVTLVGYGTTWVAPPNAISESLIARVFLWEITCVLLHCHLLFVETLAPLAIRSWPSLLLCWWSSRVRQN